MSTVGKTSVVVAAAAPGTNVDNVAAARKRRRWSAAQEDLVPSRFVRKKQQTRAVGRQHLAPNCSDSSLNSLAAFQCNSNPIFELSDSKVLGDDVVSSPCVVKTFNIPWKDSRAPPSALVPATVDENNRSTVIQEEAETDNESAPPSMPQSSTSWDGGSCWGWGSEESKDDSRTSSLKIDEGDRKGSPVIATAVSSEGYGSEAQNKNEILAHGPVSESLNHPNEELEIESCERRSRELLKKFQANAAADLALLKAYKDTIDNLRTARDKHETVAREQTNLHQDVVSQLATLRDHCKKLEEERNAEATANQELTRRCESLESQLRESNASTPTNQDSVTKLRDAEDAQQGWRMKAEALERELSTLKSRMGSSAIAGEETGFAEERTKRVTSETTILVQSTKAIISSPPPAAQSLCSETLAEIEALRAERTTLRNDILSAEKRVEEAQKERDAVVLAVQSEWDAVKIAFREDKAKLQLELDRSKEQKAKLERELDIRNRYKDVERRREEKRSLDIDLADILNHSRQLEEETEAVIASLAVVRDGNTKLEDDVRNEKSKLDREREALISLREERQTIEGEKLKLERDREALISLRDERRKIETERAGVVKAMRGENDKLESEREILMAMQAYLTKLEMKQDHAGTTSEEDKKGKRVAAIQDDDNHRDENAIEAAAPFDFQRVNIEIHTNRKRGPGASRK